MCETIKSKEKKNKCDAFSPNFQQLGLKIWLIKSDLGFVQWVFVYSISMCSNFEVGHIRLEKRLKKRLVFA